MLLTEKPRSLDNICLVTVSHGGIHNSLLVLLLQHHGSVVHVVNLPGLLYLGGKYNVCLSFLILDA